MHPWVIAIIASVGASFLTVLGFVMQKKAVMSPGDWHRIGDVVLSPMWFGGTFLNVIAPFPGDCVAYSLAPMSLTTPLSGVTVVLNLCIAPWMLGEELQYWVDMPATAMILAGTVLTSYAGVKNDIEHSFDDLKALARQPSFLVAFSVLVCLVVCCVIAMVIRRDQIEAAAKARASNPNLAHVMLPALAAAGAGAVTNIMLKGVSEQASQGAWIECILLLVLGVVPPAILQLNFVNRGLRLYMQIVIFSVYSALLVLANTLYGSLFYGEYVTLLRDGLRTTLFGFGIVLIMLGIAFFTRRAAVDPTKCNAEQNDDYTGYEVASQLITVA